MEAAYRVLAEQALELVARHALDSTFKYLSRASVSLLGRAASELLGQRALDLVAAEDKERVRSALSGLLSGTYPRVRYAARYLHKSGEWVWLDVTAYPVVEPHDSSIREYVTVAEDARPERARSRETPTREPQLARLAPELAAVHGLVSPLTQQPDELAAERERQLQLRFEASLEVSLGLSGRRAALLRDLRVLVVDDSQVARELLTRSLLALGTSVCAVPTPEAALEALRESDTRGTPFQVALIDVQLDKNDGIELARQVAQGALPGVKPVLVMISAHAREVLTEISDLAQIKAFLRKPISHESLLDTLVEVMQPAEPEHPTAPVSVQAVPRAAPNERKKPLQGIVLLVVEDNEINQILARDLLEAAGATVVLASDGPQALELAAQRTPGFDAILMDVQMPGMDGHATTRRMRDQPRTAQTPIIAMTAHAFDAERAKCLTSGMNAHVSKPINPRELVQTVLQWARPGSVTAEKPSKPARPAPEPHAAKEADLDISALALVFKDPARQLDFLRKFVDTAQRALVELDDAWRARDHQTLGFLGHKLKSSAKACGAHALAATLAQIERESKSPGWAILDALRMRAHVLLGDVVEAVAEREAATARDPGTPRA